jgi:uncharacterized protein YecE (DUF72 family)
VTAVTGVRTAGRVHVGTSGYMYDHWRGQLYPEGLGKAQWLSCYARVFHTLELNTTFYRLASPRAVDEWRQRTPPDFLFACKGSRFLTHMKKLADPAVALERFFAPVDRLGAKLALVLWQLPPQMNRADPGRLKAFLDQLPRHVRHVFEFRHESWYTDAVLDLLDEHGSATCEHDRLALAPPRVTGGFRYLRFHGPTGNYDGRYGREALRGAARDLASWRAGGRDAYVYFNNDLHGCAIHDAVALLELLGTATSLAPCTTTPVGRHRRVNGG